VERYWQKSDRKMLMKLTPDLTLFKNFEDAAPILKNNSFAVFYGQEMIVNLKFDEFPCKIIDTSRILRQVIFMHFILQFFPPYYCSNANWP